MEAFFFENPLWLGICGAFVTIVAVVLWVQTGTRSAAVSAVVACLLTILLVLVSLRVETDREKLIRTINAVAEAVESNDLERVLRHVSPNATQGLRRARQELPQYTFREARMTRLKSILVNRNSTPPTAIAEFSVIVDVGAGGSGTRIPRFVKAYFIEDAGRWLVRDYEHFEAGAAFRK